MRCNAMLVQLISVFLCIVFEPEETTDLALERRTAQGKAINIHNAFCLLGKKDITKTFQQKTLNRISA